MPPADVSSIDPTISSGRVTGLQHYLKQQQQHLNATIGFKNHLTACDFGFAEKSDEICYFGIP